MSVAVWGLDSKMHWKVHVLDFTAVVSRTCGPADYTPWNVHDGNCVFGHALVIDRLRADSWCSNGHAYLAKNVSQPCPCTKEDFECEYGYWRAVNEKICRKNPFITKLDICRKVNMTIWFVAHREVFHLMASLQRAVYLVKSSGYRKLPGNRCQGGWQPKVSESFVKLKEQCSDDHLAPEISAERNKVEQKKANVDNGLNGRAILAIILISLTFLVFAVLCAIVFYKRRAGRLR